MHFNTCSILISIYNSENKLFSFYMCNIIVYIINLKIWFVVLLEKIIRYLYRYNFLFIIFFVLKNVAFQNRTKYKYR